MRSVLRAVKRLRTNENGSSTIEYALIIAMLSAVVLLVMQTGGATVANVFSRLGTGDAVAVNGSAHSAANGGNSDGSAASQASTASGGSSALVLFTAFAVVLSSLGLTAYR